MTLRSVAIVPWLCASLVSTRAVAQGAVVTAMVVDSTRATAVVAARVEVRRPSGAVVSRAETDARGRFLFRLGDGSYRMTAMAVGYHPAPEQVIHVEGGSPVTVTLRLVPRPPVLAPIEVVAREPQALVDVPAAVAVIEIGPETPIALSPARLLESDARITVARKGLTQATFTARGPSSVNSASLLVLHDYRLASVPALRLNVPYLVPASTEDLERIEVSRGPSSVVYGADADRGVVNLVTRSPFDSRGTTITTTTGERSVHQIGLRHAGQVGERLAFTLSGEYLTGRDWTTTDASDAVPRDPDVERVGGEGRIDWRPDERSTVIFAAGLAQAIRTVDLTEIGAVQLKDWRTVFGQGRFRRDRLFVNLYYNLNDAGESFQLATAAPIVDDSRTMTVQLQYGSTLGGRTDLTYGADVQRIDPRTGGTIHGRNEERDDILLAGVFLSATTALSSRLQLVSSLRGDHHDRLDDFVLSPRVGVVYQPAEAQAIRLTYNRATSTPVASDLFLDLVVDQLQPFEIRARGTADAFTFRRDCGGLCMRSPFVGDATAFLPLDASVAWPALQSILQPLVGIPAPTMQEVPTVLGILNLETQRFDPVAAADIRDIPAARRTTNATVEAGYRGEIVRAVSVDLDVYHSTLTNVVTPLSAQTPNAFLEQSALTAYLSGFAAVPDPGSLAALVSSIPLGTVSPQQGDSTEILLLGRQSGKVRFWGADLALRVGLGAHFALTGTGSWTSKNRVPSAGGFSDIVFNAPKTRGSLGLAYRNARRGVAAEAKSRAVASFPVKSGVFRGTVDSYQVLDGTVSYRFPWAQSFTLALTVDNLLNERHREFVGAPEIGRLVLGRVRADF